MSHAVLLLAFPLVGFAPAPFARPASPELKKLQGEWEIVEWVKWERVGLGRRKRGELLSEQLLGNVIEGQTARLIRDRLVLHNLDKSIEWHLSLASGKAMLSDPRKRVQRQGIYKVEGDTLTICYTDPGHDRPEEFTRVDQWMLVLKRKQPRR